MSESVKIIPAQPGWKVLDGFPDEDDVVRDLVEIEVIAWIIYTRSYEYTDKNNPKKIKNFFDKYTVQIMPIVTFGEEVLDDPIMKTPDGNYQTQSVRYGKDKEDIIRLFQKN